MIISRETMELNRVENTSYEISVIGASHGAGAGFICALLERELRASGKNPGAGSAGLVEAFADGDPDELAGDGRADIADIIEIRDVGENGVFGGAEPDRLLIVADCRQELPEDVLIKGIELLESRRIRYGIVFNRAPEGYHVPVKIKEAGKDIPCFMIPEMDLSCFTDMYNFIFYS